MKAEKICALLLAAVLAAVAAGCAQPSRTVAVPEEFRLQGQCVATEKGVYRVKNDEDPYAFRLDQKRIFYIDWDGCRETLFCTKEGCTHDTGDCPAWVGQGRMFGTEEDGSLLIDQPAEDGDEVWRVAPDGSEKTLVARCPAAGEGDAFLVGKNGTGIWSVAIREGGTYSLMVWQQPGQWTEVFSAGEVFQWPQMVRDNAFYYETWDNETKRATLWRAALELSAEPERVVEYSIDWNRILLQGDAVWLADGRTGTISAKPLDGTGEAVAVCTLPEQAREHIVEPIDTDGSRMVLSWDGSFWAMDLSTGETVKIPPAGVDASGYALLPAYYIGSAGGQWALTDGYLRSREGIQYTGEGIRRTPRYDAQPCRLDREALLDGKLSLTEIRSDS